MKIIDAITDHSTLSFEFFPPKDPSNIDTVFRTVKRLASFDPDFVSVTYGAGGSTRRLTVELAERARVEAELNVMAHVTCAAQTRDEIHTVLERCRQSGIGNVIALRGDPPAGSDRFIPHENGFEHASDLIDHIARQFDFGIAAAAYPEGHQESPSLDQDIVHTRTKVESGADFLITQLFYDNSHYYGLLDRAAKVGLDVPIIPGLMPILSANQARKITGLCGASLPPDLDAALVRYADDTDTVRRLSIDHTIAQARDLLDNGAPGIHFYVLNRSYSISRILGGLNFPKRATVA